ncbi:MULTISPECIES: HupE/UreJ family protein [unclassified Paenibacillus]|uniref:HupE/UreJ family protein n=1 Tax=unclassified Paenibacillus TaxID=185978 RepID=UPI000954EF13|nr:MULTISPECIES: HupE/UreJ family protein [unclassified Paenibacillus]ASS68563.1 HupE/UreJ family protein [Paenibacillus sp. RUD330]SIR63498.1 Hydrogenase/urease accessory protein HupE [Paenibacillus sp. RU4X]SIR71831.1 Hydrogenase/urease accessory protein HupE [Paenibacillus sp. RU4T]
MKRAHRRRRLSLALIGLLLVSLASVRGVSAHAYSASYTTLELSKTEIAFTYAIDELSVMELAGGDEDKNGMLDEPEFESVKARLGEVLESKITLKIAGEAQKPAAPAAITLDRKGSGTQAVYRASYPAPVSGQPASLDDQLYLNDAKSNYVNLATIKYGKQTSTSALSGSDRSWTLLLTEADYASLPDHPSADDGSAPQADGGQAGSESQGTADKISDGGASPFSGWKSFFSLGVHHILGGYDHLLFLFSLLIARQSFKQYAATITAFTVAHSLTLTLTVLGWIDVPGWIVEPLIALSICYVAVENIIRKKVSRRWVLTFFFGLVHGMGFADILKGMNIPSNQLAVNLVSFNLGIEAVQLAIVAVLLPLLLLLRRSRHDRKVMLAGSAAALLFGGIWLAERVLSL